MGQNTVPSNSLFRNLNWIKMADIGLGLGIRDLSEAKIFYDEQDNQRKGHMRQRQASDKDLTERAPKRKRKKKKHPRKKPTRKRQKTFPNQFVCSLDILKIQTNKDLIFRRQVQKDGLIPNHPTSAIFSGSTGSGKSTVLCNILTRAYMLGPTEAGRPDTAYFDEYYLFSPTAKSDDMFEFLGDVLGIPDSNIFTSPDEKDLQNILDKQRQTIENVSMENAPRVLIIFEDIISNSKFMNTKPFIQAFVANRHYNVSTYITTQAFKKVPKTCRLQSRNTFYFEGSQSELEIISEEYCPPGMNKREFGELIKQITRGDHDFLYYKKDEPMDRRYRHNLHTIVDIRTEEQKGYDGDDECEKDKDEEDSEDEEDEEQQQYDRDGDEDEDDLDFDDDDDQHHEEYKNQIY